MKQISAFSFSELSETAKQKAIADERNRILKNGFSWESENRQSLRKFLKELNFSIDRHENIEMDEVLKELTGLRLRTYLLNNHYKVLFEKRPQGEFKERGNNKLEYKRKSQVFWQPTQCPFSGYYMDDVLLDPIRDFIKNPNHNTDFEDLLMSCILKWQRAVEEDQEFQLSDECIAETLQANDYDFLSNGSIL